MNASVHNILLDAAPSKVGQASQSHMTGWIESSSDRSLSSNVSVGGKPLPAYLKIKVFRACPPKGFTVLGISLADTSDNQGVIG